MAMVPVQAGSARSMHSHDMEASPPNAAKQQFQLAVHVGTSPSSGPLV